MSLVILHPHSATNPSDDHLVVNYVEWVKYTNGDARSYSIPGRFTSFEAAKEYMDTENAAIAAAEKAHGQQAVDLVRRTEKLAEKARNR